MKHSFYILVFLLSFMPSLSGATEDVISNSPAVFNENSPHVELESGRIYYLVNTNVIEEIRIKNIPNKYNVFDFDNGIIIHNLDNSPGCQNLVTPMSELPPGRADEVRNIGCQIYANEKRMVKRLDELDYFNTKFCQSAQ